MTPVAPAEQMTFTGTPDALRARLAKLEAAQ
jgi:hypothetical protein